MRPFLSLLLTSLLLFDSTFNSARVPPPEDPILGLDFGVSSYCVGIWHDGRAELIRSSCSIPYTNNLNPLTGRRPNDPLVPPPRATAEATDLVASFLSSIRSKAQTIHGDTIEKIVISFPHEFSIPDVRTLFKTAAERAGLKIVRFVPAPNTIGGAIRSDKEATIVHAHADHASLSLSFLSLSRGITELEAHERVAIPHVAPSYGNPDILTTAGEVSGGEIDAGVLAAAVTPALETLISDANDDGDITGYIVTGEVSTRPAIRVALANVFKNVPEMPLPAAADVTPETVLALGATNLGSLYSVPPRAPDLTSLDLGIETAGGIFIPIIRRDTQFPARMSASFIPALQTQLVDNTIVLPVRVYAGARPFVKDNRHLGTLNVTRSPSSFAILVAFSLDANGKLTVTAGCGDRSCPEHKLEVDWEGMVEAEQMLRIARFSEPQDEKDQRMMEEFVLLEQDVDRIDYLISTLQDMDAQPFLALADEEMSWISEHFSSPDVTWEAIHQRRFHLAKQLKDLQTKPEKEPS